MHVVTKNVTQEYINNFTTFFICSLFLIIFSNTSIAQSVSPETSSKNEPTKLKHVPQNVDWANIELRLPSKEQLTLWLQVKEAGVWIDGKRVDNSILKEYSSKDFGHYMVSKLARNATNYGKHRTQVNLMTKDYFKNFKNKMAVKWSN